MGPPRRRNDWHDGCLWRTIAFVATKFLSRMSLSLMLGVRRAGVTVGLHYLEQRGLIRMARKQIVITDRDGLKAAANGTYHQPERPS